GGSAPDQCLGSGRVHVNRKLTHVDGGRLTGRRLHTAGAIPAAAIPAWSVAPAGTEGGELFFGVDRGLISDVEVCAVGLRFRQTLCFQFSLDGCLDLLVDEIVDLLGVF